MTALSRLLAKSKELREAATFGEWEYDADENEVHAIRYVGCSGDPYHVCPPENDKANERNGPFIAHARNTAEAKDKMIEIMAEAIWKVKNCPKCDLSALCGGQLIDALTKVEALAKESL